MKLTKFLIVAIDEGDAIGIQNELTKCFQSSGWEVANNSRLETQVFSTKVFNQSKKQLYETAIPGQEFSGAIFYGYSKEGDESSVQIISDLCENFAVDHPTCIVVYYSNKKYGQSISETIIDFKNLTPASDGSFPYITATLWTNIQNAATTAFEISIRRETELERNMRSENDI